MSRWSLRVGYVIGGIGFVLALGVYLVDYLPVGAADLVVDVVQQRPHAGYFRIVRTEDGMGSAGSVSAVLLVIGLGLLAAGKLLKRRGR